MIKTCIILFFSFCNQFVIAQKAVVGTGGNATGVGGSFSYSVGQIAYNFSTSANGSASEGVQQPFEILTLGTDDFPNIILEMTVYPNPTTSKIILKITDLDSENLRFQILDLTGKLISKDLIVNSETQISFENLNSGIYFLKVIQSNKIIKTFKIIKQ